MRIITLILIFTTAILAEPQQFIPQSSEQVPIMEVLRLSGGKELHLVGTQGEIQMWVEKVCISSELPKRCIPTRRLLEVVQKEGLLSK